MKTKTYKYIVGVLALSLLTACDFERVNTNEFELLPEEGLMDGISIGGPITAMEKCVFPVGTQADGTAVVNRYQTAYNLAADCWSGYFGQNNNWEAPTTLTISLKMVGLHRPMRKLTQQLYPFGRTLKVKPRRSFQKLLL